MLCLMGSAPTQLPGMEAGRVLVLEALLHPVAGADGGRVAGASVRVQAAGVAVGPHKPEGVVVVVGPQVLDVCGERASGTGLGGQVLGHGVGEERFCPVDGSMACQCRVGLLVQGMRGRLVGRPLVGSAWRMQVGHGGQLTSSQISGIYAERTS